MNAAFFLSALSYGSYGGKVNVTLNGEVRKLDPFLLPFFIFHCYLLLLYEEKENNRYTIQLKYTSTIKGNSRKKTCHES